MLTKISVLYKSLNVCRKSLCVLQRRNIFCSSEEGKYDLGNCAVVTGATKGIGLSACCYLLQNGVMNLVMGDINMKEGESLLAKLRKQYPKTCLSFCKCDVTKKRDMECLFKHAVDLHGCFDIVINNAGIFNEKKWETMLKTNATGTVRGLMLAMKHMSREHGGKGGAIINLASILGLSTIAGAPVYCATKHFVIGLTGCYGHKFHYKKSNVRVMALCPGVTITPLIIGSKKDKSELGKQAAKELGDLPDQDVCFCGQAFITMLKEGDNGSIWVVEGEELYEVKIPPFREKFRK